MKKYSALITTLLCIIIISSVYTSTYYLFDLYSPRSVTFPNSGEIFDTNTIVPPPSTTPIPTPKPKPPPPPPPVGDTTLPTVSTSAPLPSNVTSTVNITVPPPQAGSDVYIGQTIGSGNDSGSDCNNPHSAAWFSLATNWGAGSKIGPGDTVHLCGTISTVLTIQGSGVSGSPITIVFEPGAMLSKDVWTPLGAIAGNVSWITIDGKNTGIIENTDNGTGLGHQSGSRAVNIVGDHITVKNLIIRKLYVRTPTSLDANREGYGLELTGSDIYVYHNTLSDGDSMIGINSSDPVSNIVIDSNIITKTNHAILAGKNITNITVSNNIVDSKDDWECPETGPAGLLAACKGSLHRNGIMFINETPGYGGSVNGLYIYGNLIRQGENPRSTTAGTGGIFLDGYRATQYVNVYIFNNIFTLVGPLNWANGFIVLIGTNVLIANNTMIGGTAGGGTVAVQGNNIKVYNNMKYLGGGFASVGLSGETGIDNQVYTGQLLDYNNYYGPQANGFGTKADYNASSIPVKGIFSSIADWRTAYGWDIHTITDNPNLLNPNPLNGDYHLGSGSKAIGAGINLTSYCGTVPLLCKDYAGNPRPATGAWNIGAY